MALCIAQAAMWSMVLNIFCPSLGRLSLLSLLLESLSTRQLDFVTMFVVMCWMVHMHIHTSRHSCMFSELVDHYLLHSHNLFSQFDRHLMFV